MLLANVLPPTLLRLGSKQILLWSSKLLTTNLRLADRNIMSAFNRPPSTRTSNIAGGEAFRMSDKTELYTRVATSLWGQSTYYRSPDQFQDDFFTCLRRNIKNDPEWVLQLAQYARNVLNIRTTPLVMLTEVFNQAPGTVNKGYAYVPKIVRRADEITEVIAYQLARNALLPREGKKIPKSLQKGLSHAMRSFNEYNFSKYDRKGIVTFYDAMRLIRPSPESPEQETLFSKLAKGEGLEASTWERIVSSKGSTREAWEEAVEVMPIMATIRNMRNLLKHQVRNIDTVFNRLRDPEIIAHSKQFPYRFWSAYREIEHCDEILFKREALDAISDAMDLAVVNLPTLSGKTAIIVDLSGSMDYPLHNKTEVTRKEVACITAAIANRAFENPAICGFANETKWFNLSKREPIISAAEHISNVFVGGATFAHVPILDLVVRREKVDRIVLISDMQCYTDHDAKSLSDAFREYRAVNPEVKFYSIDVTGYGSSVVPEYERGVHLLAGWNSNLFSYIDAMEKSNTSINEIVQRYVS